jgi:UDPglucose 6-dehydrogenase
MSTENERPRVSIIGLGKLGASMAAGMAHRGFQVVGVDVSIKAVDAINQGLAPVQETGLAEMIASNRERLRATLDTNDAIQNSDISFVIVPTPSDDKGSFSLQYAAYAFEAIGKALRNKKGYHVVVLTSTVLPGATRYGLLPILEKMSGKKCGEAFGLCYSPEFIALGTVIRDFLNPDFYLIGEFDKRSGDMLELVDRAVCQKAQPVCRRMSIENAEIAKIALNSFVTMKISFANVLADLCERVPGGDVDVVSDAIGTDSRIGRKYLSGGLGFAGPCFPRDNVALDFFGRGVGADTSLLHLNDAYNRRLAGRIVEKVRSVLQPGSNVAILGLAYKPLSHVIEESQGVQLARALSDSGFRVMGFDPLAGEAARSVLGYHALVADSVDEALVGAQAVVVTTRDAVFEGLSVDRMLSSSGQSSLTVIDCWRFLGTTISQDPRIRYIPLGRCIDNKKAESDLSALWS